MVGHCSLPIILQIYLSLGVGYNLQSVKEGTAEISSLFNAPVDFCFNPTQMTSENDYKGWLTDLTQAGTQKLGRVTAEVNALARYVSPSVELDLKTTGTCGRPSPRWENPAS